MVFFAIWWAWMNVTWFASAYDTDDVGYRVAVLAMIAGALVLAAGVPRAFLDTDFGVVTLGYVVLRIPLVLLWLRAARARRGAAADRPAHGGRRHRCASSAGSRCCSRPPASRGSGSRCWWSPSSPCRTSPSAGRRRRGTRRTSPSGTGCSPSSCSASPCWRGRSPSARRSTSTSSARCGASPWAACCSCSPCGGSTSPGRPTTCSPTARTAFRWGYGHYVVFASAAAVGAGIAVNVDAATGVGLLDLRAAAATVTVPAALYIATVWWLHLRPHEDAASHGVLVAVGVPALLLATLAPQPVLVAGLVAAALVAAAVRPRPARHRARRARGLHPLTPSGPATEVAGPDEVVRSVRRGDREVVDRDALRTDVGAGPVDRHEQLAVSRTWTRR